MELTGLYFFTLDLAAVQSQIESTFIFRHDSLSYASDQSSIGYQ